MNWIKRQINYYQFEALNSIQHKFNDMDQGIGVVDDNDYSTVLYYTPGINKNMPIKMRLRDFISNVEYINKHEMYHFLDLYEED